MGFADEGSGILEGANPDNVQALRTLLNLFPPVDVLSAITLLLIREEAHTIRGELWARSLYQVDFDSSDIESIASVAQQRFLDEGQQAYLQNVVVPGLRAVLCP